MTTQIGASVFADPTQIRHDVHNGNPTLTFGPWPTVNRVDVHLGDVATIDKVIAELVALRNEMEPPVIPPAERDCPALNPDGDWPCHRGGQHDEHEDDNGSTWTSAPERTAAVCGIRHNAAGHALCTREPGHAGGHKNTRTGDYWPASVAS